MSTMGDTKKEVAGRTVLDSSYKPPLWQEERTRPQTCPPGAHRLVGTPGLEAPPGETPGGSPEDIGDVLLLGSGKSPKRRGICPEP